MIGGNFGGEPLQSDRIRKVVVHCNEMKSCKGTWFRAGSGLLICYVFDWNGGERELEWLVVGFLMLKMISVVRNDSLDGLRLGAPD